MIDSVLLGFSFVQGGLAFFAPCAVALLPGYLSAFVARNLDKGEQTKGRLLKRALLLSFLTILGIASVYGIASFAIMLFASVVKKVIVYLGVILGVVIVVLGLFMIKGKALSFSFHGSRTKSKNLLIESYLFGVSYGIGSLACLFPLFLVVATSALQSGSFVVGLSYFVSYAVGMSMFMLVFYLLAVFAKDFLRSSVSKVMPYLNRVGGVIVVLAGLYIIWYQGRVLIL